MVQVYTSAPKCRLEMPKLELRAFKKTKLLEPGETQDIALEFAAAEMASYDERLAAYVLPAGEYTVLVGNSVRNLNEAGRFSNEKEWITRQLKNRCVPRKLPRRLKADGSYEELETGEYEVQYDTSDWPEKPYLWDVEHILPNMYESRHPRGGFL